MNFYPLASSTWDDEEIETIQAVIDKGMYTMSESVSRFEKQFAAYVGSSYSVMVNSGSSANLLAVAAFFYRKGRKLVRGDEVIVPAVSWSTTYYPLHQYGLKLKFVDIDINTLNYDLKALKNAISDKTKMIMVVNLLGNPNDFSVIEFMIKDKDIIIIEDNCESMGATFNGKHTGTFGEMGTYSCFFSHHISTMEGGMIVTDDEELFHILLALRAHGWTRNLPHVNRVTGIKSEDPFEESFRFVLPGYNVRPLEMSGAIGTVQLKKLTGFIEARRENAERFIDLFANSKLFHIQQEIGESSWFGFSFVIKDGMEIDRKTVVKYLQENGVECRPIVAGNFAKNEVVKLFDHEIFDELDNAQRVDKRGFFIGNHHYPLNNSLNALKQLLNKFQ